MGKIVFCDDDRIIRRLVSAALRSMPHDLHLAADGCEGLEVIEREMPDVVFSDMLMPRLDGMQLLGEIKSRPHLAHIPVVVVSASVQPRKVEEAYSHGAADYLRKPFDLEELRDKVREYVGADHN